MTQLSVNINKVALLRNSRGHNQPNLLEFAQTILNTGAHGITIHPRPDQRHITVADVMVLKYSIDKFNLSVDTAKTPRKEFNIEGNPFEVAFSQPKSVHGGNNKSYPGFMDIIKESLPDQATLVPDQRHQLTSDHGWDLEKDNTRLKKAVKTLKDLNIRTSLFLDMNCPSTHILSDIGIDRVELYTEKYAVAHNTNDQAEVLKAYADKAQEINELGIDLNAGHDLNQFNLANFLNTIPQIKEVSIGHALISESLYEGVTTTIKKYLACLKK